MPPGMRPRPPALPPKRTNVLEFKFMFSDRSHLEGSWTCSDEQWGKILTILTTKEEPEALHPTD
jgi:hypothetical protein